MRGGFEGGREGGEGGWGVEESGWRWETFERLAARVAERLGAAGVPVYVLGGDVVADLTGCRGREELSKALRRLMDSLYSADGSSGVGLRILGAGKGLALLPDWATGELREAGVLGVVEAGVAERIAEAFRVSPTPSAGEALSAVRFMAGKQTSIDTMTVFADCEKKDIENFLGLAPIPQAAAFYTTQAEAATTEEAWKEKADTGEHAGEKHEATQTRPVKGGEVELEAASGKLPEQPKPGKTATPGMQEKGRGKRSQAGGGQGGEREPGRGNRGLGEERKEKEAEWWPPALFQAHSEKQVEGTVLEGDTGESKGVLVNVGDLKEFYFAVEREAGKAETIRELLKTIETLGGKAGWLAERLRKELGLGGRLLVVDVDLFIRALRETLWGVGEKTVGFPGVLNERVPLPEEVAWRVKQLKRGPVNKLFPRIRMRCEEIGVTVSERDVYAVFGRGLSPKQWEELCRRVGLNENQVVVEKKWSRGGRGERVYLVNGWTVVLKKIRENGFSLTTLSKEVGVGHEILRGFLRLVDRERLDAILKALGASHPLVVDADRFTAKLFVSLAKKVGMKSDPPVNGWWNLINTRVKVESSTVKEMVTVHEAIKMNIKLSRPYISNEINKLIKEIEAKIGGVLGHGGKTFFYKELGLQSIYMHKHGVQRAVRGDDIIRFTVLVLNTLGYRKAERFLKTLRETRWERHSYVEQRRKKNILGEGAERSPFKMAESCMTAFNLKNKISQVVVGLGGIAGYYLSDATLKADNAFTYYASKRGTCMLVANDIKRVTGRKPEPYYVERSNLWCVQSSDCGKVLLAWRFKPGDKTLPDHVIPIRENVRKAMESSSLAERISAILFEAEMHQAAIVGDGNVRGFEVDLTQTLKVAHKRGEGWLKKNYMRLEELLKAITGERTVESALEKAVQYGMAIVHKIVKPETGKTYPYYILKWNRLYEYCKKLGGETSEIYKTLKKHFLKLHPRLYQLEEGVKALIKNIGEELGTETLEVKTQVKPLDLRIAVREDDIYASLTGILRYRGWTAAMLLPFLKGVKEVKLAKKVAVNIAKSWVKPALNQEQKLIKWIEENQGRL
ncbi:MAG: hypothetical protein ACTSUS_02875, partial [Candidatus Freyarchaeota archaeon]